MLKIIKTSDGSHSLFNEDLNETYHSVHGAIQESVHVFIKCGLEYLFEKKPKNSDLTVVSLPFWGITK